MTNLKLFFALVLVASLFMTGNSLSDQVTLKNGDSLTGKIIKMQGSFLTLETSYAGKLSIKWDQVESIETQQPVKVVLTDDSSFSGVVISGESGNIEVKTQELEKPISFQLPKVKAINPPPPGPAVKVTGNVNLGVVTSKGNTDNQNIHADAELVVRTEKDRFTVGGWYNRTEDNNVKTADSTVVYINYDYFITKKWYFSLNAAGEKDEFKDLDLRTTGGVGVGYQFLETEITNLSLGAGINYVNEDFIEAEDNNYMAGRWNFNFDHFFLDKRLQFFHRHTGLISLEDTDDMTIWSQTGLRLPITEHFNSTLQANLDWDKSPSPGRKKTDTTYIVTLGYSW